MAPRHAMTDGRLRAVLWDVVVAVCAALAFVVLAAAVIYHVYGP